MTNTKRLRRLTESAERDAIAAFADYMLADPTPASSIGFMDGCEVLYRDDYDTDESSYQVVDAQGHGDGSGMWTPVGDGADTAEIQD